MCPIFNVLNIMRHHLSRLVSLVNCNKKSKIDVRYPLPFFSYIIIIFVLGAVHKGHHHLKKIIKFLWNFFQILSQKRFFSNFIGKGCNLGNSTMCWHKDIAKFQMWMKTILNQCLGIQYECRLVNFLFLCTFNETLIDFIMTLLTKRDNFCHLYVVKF